MKPVSVAVEEGVVANVPRFNKREVTICFSAAFLTYLSWDFPWFCHPATIAVTSNVAVRRLESAPAAIKAEHR